MIHFMHKSSNLQFTQARSAKKDNKREIYNIITQNVFLENFKLKFKGEIKQFKTKFIIITAQQSGKNSRGAIPY